MADIKIGDEFRVKEIEPWTENDILLSRYLPQFVYRVTDRNMAFISSLFDEGKAELSKAVTKPGANVVAGKSKSAGKVRAKKGK